MAVPVHQVLNDIETERIKLREVLKAAGYDPYNTAEVSTGMKGNSLMVTVQIGVQMNYNIKRTDKGIELTRVDFFGKPIEEGENDKD